MKNLDYFYHAAVNTIKHDGIEHAGYMAFLSVLSLFPFIVFIVALIGSIGDSFIGKNYVNFIYKSLPKSFSVSIVEPRIREIILGPPQGLLNLAIFGAIWTASSSVEGLRTILNRIYEIQSPPAYVWRRMLSIIQFLILTILILFTILILIIIPNFIDKISYIFNFSDKLNNFSEYTVTWNYVRYFIVETVLFLVVLVIYYVIPNVKVNLKSLVPGAVIVAILWSGGGAVLSLYLTHFKQVSLIYGSLAGVIATLLFFYIMNLILIYGAEFNYLLNNKNI